MGTPPVSRFLLSIISKNYEQIKRVIILWFVAACFLFAALKAVYDLIFTNADRPADAVLILLLSIPLVGVVFWPGLRELREYQAIQPEYKFRPVILKRNNKNDNG